MFWAKLSDLSLNRFKLLKPNEKPINTILWVKVF